MLLWPLKANTWICLFCCYEIVPTIFVFIWNLSFNNCRDNPMSNLGMFFTLVKSITIRFRKRTIVCVTHTPFYVQWTCDRLLSKNNTNMLRLLSIFRKIFLGWWGIICRASMTGNAVHAFVVTTLSSRRFVAGPIVHPKLWKSKHTF